MLRSCSGFPLSFCRALSELAKSILALGEIKIVLSSIRYLPVVDETSEAKGNRLSDLSGIMQTCAFLSNHASIGSISNLYNSRDASMTALFLSFVLRESIERYAATCRDS